VEATVFVRYHPQEFVRRAVLYSIARIPLAVPPDILKTDIFSQPLIELIGWLEEETERDTDIDCRALAGNALGQLAVALAPQGESKLDGFITGGALDLTVAKEVRFK